VRSASTVANTAFDQNGDGVFDQEDLKLLTKKGLDVGKAVAKEAGNMAKQASQSALVQDVAAAAAVGAVLGTMIPLVGTVGGTVIGGVGGAYGHIKKDK
jgi:hypothetical protein